MSMRSILTILILQMLTGSLALAQSSKLEDYFQGHLTLNDNSILAGEINYNYGAQTISIKIDSTVQIYGPNQVIQFTVVKNEVVHLFKSLNLGDGLRVYRVIGESNKVAYLEHIYGENTHVAGSPGLTDPLTGLPMSGNPDRLRRGRSLETTKDSKIVTLSDLIAVTSTGKQYIFRLPRPHDVRLKNREYLTNKKQVMGFLESIDPTIESYMKENGLKFRRDRHRILEKTLKP